MAIGYGVFGGGGEVVRLRNHVISERYVISKTIN